MNAFDLLRNRLTDGAAGTWDEVRRYVRCDPGILGGKPTFVGTRVPVYMVLECLAAGMVTKQILEAFPSLEPEHVPAALKFAGLLAQLR